MRFFLAVFLLVLTLANASAQTCNYLAYEGFSYNPNLPLHGLQGGTGWAAPWEVQVGNTNIPGYQTNSGSPMTYQDLQTLGNYETGSYQYLSAGRNFNLSSSGPFQPWLDGQGAIGQAGTTLWASILLRKTANNNETSAAYWHPNNINWCWNCSTARIGAGYFGEPSNDPNSGIRYWSLFLNNNVYRSSIPVSAGATAFLVLKIEFGASQTTVSLFVNPATLGNDIPAPDLVQSSSSPLVIRSLALYQGSNTNMGDADEIRMGASYPCVAPDADVAVNLPPNADFTFTPPSGTAPLSVAFDGSISNDPDGSVAAYSWNFGDGSPGASGPSVNHTFTATGILSVALTITDNLGLQHTITKNITVLNQFGTFTCQMRLNCEQLPTCTQSVGRFRVPSYNSNYTLTLRDGANSIVPPNSGNAALYENLAPGAYKFYVAGNNGCRDTFDLFMPRDSSTCPGWEPQACAMGMGVGIEGLAYWTPSRPFKDYFKSTGYWVTYNPAGGPWDSNDQQYIPLDANGYPTVIPFSTPNGNRAVRNVISAEGHIPTNTPLRLLYEGQGAIQMQGGLSVNGTGAGYIDFTINNTGNIWFHITQSQQGDHIRNIRIVAHSDLSTYETQPFRQSFLDNCSKFYSIRFMDWMGTNGSGQTQWSGRSKPGWFSQANNPNGGVAYEYIIQLANTINRDIWICVPHQADDNYITQMATMFRDQLNPGIQVYLEYSNEVWNWIFSQAHWVNANGPQNISYPRRYTERALHAFDIWHNVWGAQKTRVHRVLGTQMGYDWVSEEILAHADQNRYDYFSPSWYFGLDHSANGNPNLQSLGNSATATDVLSNSRNAWVAALPGWRTAYRTTFMYGKKIINYEGGQHFTDFSVPPYIQAMYDAQVHPGMYDLYNEVLDTMRRMKSEMPYAFIMTGPWQSVYGSWGHLFEEDDPAPWNDRPKFQVLIDQMNQCATSPLDVEWTNFSIQCIKGDLLFQWQTALEYQTTHFEAEGSADGQEWQTLSRLSAQGKGAYQYRFSNKKGLQYFRIRSVNEDGSFSFTPIRQSTCGIAGEITLQPNPAGSNSRLQVPAAWLERNLTARLENVQGRLIRQWNITADQSEIPLTELPQGLYFIRVFDSDNGLLLDAKTLAVQK